MALRFLLAAAIIAIALPAAAAGSVLYVGDSLGVGTSPQLRDQVGSALEADVLTGRPSGVGVDVLRALISSEHDAVIFDLGTNDDPGAPEELAASLNEAARVADGRCVVVATLNRPPLDGVAVDGLNRAVVGFARINENVELVDWHEIAAENPGLLIDGVHSTGPGYALRARLFADALGNCLELGGRPRQRRESTLATARTPVSLTCHRHLPVRTTARPIPKATRCSARAATSPAALRSSPARSPALSARAPSSAELAAALPNGERAGSASPRSIEVLAPS